MQALIRQYKKSGTIPIVEIVEAGFTLIQFISEALKSGVPNRKQLAELQALQADQLHKLELRILELEKKSF